MSDHTDLPCELLISLLIRGIIVRGTPHTLPWLGLIGMGESLRGGDFQVTKLSQRRSSSIVPNLIEIVQMCEQKRRNKNTLFIGIRDCMPVFCTLRYIFLTSYKVGVTWNQYGP
jgi:hypothetical protein